MLRTLFCLNGPDAVNGPNVWLTRHLPLLARKGIEPVVLYLSWAPDKPCRYRRLLESESIATVPVRLGRFIEDNTAALARAADALAADVFVPNYSVAGYYAARFLRATGVATVGILHSDDPYYHDIIDVFVAGPERWRLSAVVGVSDYLRTLFLERTGGSVPFLHAPYGSPVPQRRAMWMPKRFRMVYFGRMVERQKRINRVVEAMSAAALAVQGVEGLLYGDGPERPRLERLLAASAGRVRLGGLLDPDLVQAPMLDAQVFVLLSDFEGLSIALMEAMACGLVPIVTPMRSGVADLVEDGVTGLVVPPDDPAAFAAAVSRLAGDGDFWRRLSEGARRAVVDRGYTADACADLWARFLAKQSACQRERCPLSIPHYDSWKMPPRSSRPEGIRVEDRRAAWPKMQAASEAGRPLFLWGASCAGGAFLDSLADLALPVAGFVDSDPGKQGRSLRGVPVYSPMQLLASDFAGRRPFVVITSQFETEIAASLEEMGFREDLHYVAG